MNLPQIPEDTSALSAAELRQLGEEIRAAIREGLVATPGVPTAELREAKTVADGLFAEAAERDERDALAAEMAAKKPAKKAEPKEEPEHEVEADPEPQIEQIPESIPARVPELADESVDDDETDEEEVEAAVAKVRTKLGGGAPAVPAAPERHSFSDQTVALDSIEGLTPGEKLTSWGQLASALLSKASTIRDNSSEKFAVAKVVGNFLPEQQMSESPVDNLRLFDRDEIMATLCAPLPPTYDLSCVNTERRPVRASLPTYRAPRGGVKIYPSPTLQDIVGGTGIWTYLDDANSGAVKNACAEIKCATPVDYRWYGIYRCITIKNMLAMTFPELVEAYLNRLGAAFARMAEVQLLEAMAAETTTITVNHGLGYNATTSIMSGILNYLALYREQQRWDDVEFEAWLPRWLVPALQADLVRRRNTAGGVATVPTEGQIVTMFRNAGINPHFFLDTPSWATPIPKLAVTGRLGQFTRNLEVIVAPRGKFALMDEGNLTIGVTGNNIYRDNVSNSRNQFTMFWESFEGVVNTDSCPANLLVFPNLCYNGQQIADVVIGCEGGDKIGPAS